MILFLAGQVAPRRLLLILLSVAVCLTGLNNALHQISTLDGERRVPTLFSTILILINAVLLSIIAAVVIVKRRPWSAYWAALAAIFAYLAYDELMKIHEEALDFLIPILGIHFLHFWVIPASLIIVGVGAVFWPFVRALPAPVTLFRVWCTWRRVGVRGTRRNLRRDLLLANLEEFMG